MDSGTQERSNVMSRWTIDEPTTLDFDGVVMLKATLVAGNISVLATDDRPSVHVGDVTGRPLLVSHDAGMLTISHEMLEGVLGWLRHERTSVTVTVMVPRECPVQLNLVSADAVITGLSARTSIKTGSGDVTLDGVTGQIDANTVSGVIETQGLDGTVSFNSVSGDLALAGGSLDRLAAKSVSGKIAADIRLSPGSQVQVNTVSGEVALRLPASTSAEVDLNSVAGRVETAFPELHRSERPVARGVTGTLGDGSGRLSVNTVSGSVTLLRRPDPAPLAGAPDVED
ncbi:MAG: hypothetical protein QOE54_1555 [Streptosporangiaceae bacterium]|jgi:hypothetical protein|nr:hypothetical protein [Streptosporangiaceae bacterium]MDX6429189.1 hypothetical protein [Streptosporangiaceae bacterium]